MSRLLVIVMLGCCALVAKHNVKNAKIKNRGLIFIGFIRKNRFITTNYHEFLRMKTNRPKFI